MKEGQSQRKSTFKQTQVKTKSADIQMNYRATDIFGSLAMEKKAVKQRQQAKLDLNKSPAQSKAGKF